MFRDLYRRLAGIGIAAAVAMVALGAGAALAGGGRCVSLQLADPLLLPDGSVHPSGHLKLCRKIDFSPVTTLHETFVNGRAIGLLRSRRVTNESGGSGPPVVRFVRDESGRLALTGYAVQYDQEGVAFRFDAVKPAHRRTLTAGRQPADPAESGEDAPLITVVLAATALD